jgi:hypothetical protein
MVVKGKLKAAEDRFSASKKFSSLLVSEDAKSKRIAQLRKAEETAPQPIKKIIRKQILVEMLK